MSYLLGIDTGGTFTDAALLRDGAPAEEAVLAKAKSLTTRHDLSVGIAGAVDAVLAEAGLDAAAIGLVSISTTLATNALVERQGSPIAFVPIGFSDRDLTKAGLAEALGSDISVSLPGGHGPHGAEQKALDLAPLDAMVETVKDRVSAFAVAGYFAVRNPDHELRVADFLSQRTGLPVTCSHTLSTRLNGPKRALTTVLNARLISMITALIDATRACLEARGIAAPLMVVRGDGALVSADFAAERPIETILSGPAASLVGARYLTGLDAAFVNDIGGTTSDIALLEAGKPKIDPDGAMVGGMRTMVEAVAMHTFGLGGDSQVSLGGSPLDPFLELGPSRAVPVSLLAKEHPDPVHAALDRQLDATLNGRHDGRFARRSNVPRAAAMAEGLGQREAALYTRLDAAGGPAALDDLLESTVDMSALRRLVKAGLVQMAALTPSDAALTQGHGPAWDVAAARKALTLFARRRSGSGDAVAACADDLAKTIVRRVERRSAEVVLETAFRLDGHDGAELVAHPLVRASLTALAEGLGASKAHVHSDGHSYAQSHVALDRPLIGLGASAALYHPPAATMCGVDAIVPDHADVANAVGAVVGNVRMRCGITVTQPTEGRFLVLGFEKPFGDEASAFAHAEQAARERATQLATEAGASNIVITVERSEKRVEVQERPTLVEATICAEATGRPPIVDG
ncbi:MAG: hydantoinase/oxoprolinase family protein [Pseudomonadota bacterium]